MTHRSVYNFVDVYNLNCHRADITYTDLQMEMFL